MQLDRLNELTHLNGMAKRRAPMSAEYRILSSGAFLSLSVILHKTAFALLSLSPVRSWPQLELNTNGEAPNEQQYRSPAELPSASEASAQDETPRLQLLARGSAAALGQSGARALR